MAHNSAHCSRQFIMFCINLMMGCCCCRARLPTTTTTTAAAGTGRWTWLYSGVASQPAACEWVDRQTDSRLTYPSTIPHLIHFHLTGAATHLCYLLQWHSWWWGGGWWWAAAGPAAGHLLLVSLPSYFLLLWLSYFVHIITSIAVIIGVWYRWLSLLCCVLINDFGRAGTHTFPIITCLVKLMMGVQYNKDS